MKTARRAPAAMAVRVDRELRPAFVEPRATAKVETRTGRFGFHTVAEPRLLLTSTYAVKA